MVGSIVVVSALTSSVLLHCMCDLKAAQMNLYCILIKELVLCKFEVDHIVAEAATNFYFVED